jgi:gliding motility-associated-like protein
LTPQVNTSSSATLNLNPNDVIEKAYLYWAGSGTGDFEVQLNGQNITAFRTFSHQRTIAELTLNYFSAFTDVTNLVQTTGNGEYILSDLDVSPFIEQHAIRSTNFAGWTLLILFKNNSLPLNQVNIYDGLQAVPNEINITLNSLNVVDNQDAKIGFLAWEGDSGISVNETLRINGNPISNPPLNPVDNAFNGTNSVLNSSNLYNMDLDIYNIQDTISIGDTTAEIQLTSGQDFVMINAIVTKLNSQLPDATTIINSLNNSCFSRTVLVDFTVSNNNSTNILQAGTPIAIYLNGEYIESTATTGDIPIDGSENHQISIEIPLSVLGEFEIKIVVDQNNLGQSMITEINENNNVSILNYQLLAAPIIPNLDTLKSCNEGLGKGTFNFSEYAILAQESTTDIVRFFLTENDANLNINSITNSQNFGITVSPTTVYVRVENANCFSISSFQLMTYNCPPEVFNFISANNDYLNDTFEVKGLRDIFENYKISIYNRWGVLVWTGTNATSDWDGTSNSGAIFEKGQLPSGTYYYIIDLNDPDYSKPIMGYLFLTH